MNNKSGPRKKFVTGVKLWMLCVYFPGAAVVTFICYCAGMPLVFPIAVLAGYGGALTAFYLLERWTDGSKGKARDESESSA